MIIIQQIMQFTTPRKTLMCFDMREEMIEKQTLIPVFAEEILANP